MILRLFPTKLNIVKLISICLMGLLLFKTIIPVSNYEIKSFFVSLDVIKNAPMVLETASINQLNNLIFQGFFSDNDFSEKKSQPLPVPNDTSGCVNTNVDYCLVGGIKKSLENSIIYAIKHAIFSKLELNIKTIIHSNFDSVFIRLWHSASQAKSHILDILEIQVLPRGDTPGFGMIINTNAFLISGL